MYQCDNADLCHEFSFLSSPDCDRKTFKDIAPQLLPVWSTLKPGRDSVHRSSLLASCACLGLASGAPPMWLLGGEPCSFSGTWGITSLLFHMPVSVRIHGSFGVILKDLTRKIYFPTYNILGLRNNFLPLIILYNKLPT